MAPKPPAARGFTLSEKRSLQFERVTLYMVLMVAIIAATISFRALTDNGHRMGLGWASPLLPLAIDGFGIACSVGIVRSQGAGEPGRERVSEWFGLSIALGLSIAGNVNHALISKTVNMPTPLATLFAAAIPVIVAYGIHVYGRAMARGISAHVLADDPNSLQFGLAHLGEQQTAPAATAPARKAPTRSTPARPAPIAAPAAPRQQSAPVDAAAPRQEQTAPAPRSSSGRATTPAMEAARQVYDEIVDALVASGQPFTRDDINGGALWAATEGLDGRPAGSQTTRKWLGKWWSADPRNPENTESRADQRAELHAADPAEKDPILSAVEPQDDTPPMRAAG